MKHIKRLLCGILSICLIANMGMTMVSAVDERSSAYLNLYSAGLTAKSGGKIAITVDVSGVGYMTEIGAKKIELYESSNNVTFTKIETFESDDYSDMLGSGSWYYDTPITYDGTVGRYYVAVVYCYAANSSGSDTKTYETDPCRAIR